MERDDFQVWMENDLHLGRMISWSKSGYRSKHPDNNVVFNANIVTLENGKVWHGDLDVTVDEENLQKVANILGKNLYILSEMDCRFNTEKEPARGLIKKAVYTIKHKKDGN